MNGKMLRAAAVAALSLTMALPSVPALAKEGMPGGMPGGSPGVVVEVSGIVQSMPASGLVGSWKIAGKAMQADAATKFDQEAGKLGVGAVVEAKAAPQADGSLLALKIEVKVGVGAPPGPGMGSSDDDGEEGEITGPIVSLPAGGLLGSWNVGGHTVIVVSTTRIDQEHGAVAVGAIVEVDGLPDPSGAIVAAKIEVKSGMPGMPGMPMGVPAKVEVVGLIDALPATGLIGNWTVGGRTVIVSATTVLDSENGPFVVGASVEAKGALDTAGALVAMKVETTEGNGAPETALEFWGKVTALPATGVIGVWKIDDKLVDVSAATKIEQEAVPLAVGVTVEVHGWVQPDGMIEATEIETRPAMGMVSGQGTKAVEFFNPALGHFFVSASPAEIAALDAAGRWQRTGQSFNVGAGTSGVCRFYGMPPKGPDSHFFTADPVECQAVMTQFAAWTFEGHAFSATPPVNGACPAGTLEVHRFFNNPATAGEINHRFTVTAQAFAATAAMGWTHEGVVMCAQP